MGTYVRMYGTCVQEVVCVYSEPLLSTTIVYVSYTHTRYGYIRTYVWYMRTRGGVCIQRTALICHNCVQATHIQDMGTYVRMYGTCVQEVVYVYSEPLLSTTIGDVSFMVDLRGWLTHEV